MNKIKFLKVKNSKKVFVGKVSSRFVAMCMVGVFLFSMLESVPSQLNTAHAWNSGGTPISYAGAKNPTAQSAHEKLTVACYLNNKGVEEPFDIYLDTLKSTPEENEAIELKSLEEGSYWNDFFTTYLTSMLTSYV